MIEIMTFEVDATGELALQGEAAQQTVAHEAPASTNTIDNASLYDMAMLGGITAMLLAVSVYGIIPRSPVRQTTASSSERPS